LQSHKILILTPIKDAAQHANQFVTMLNSLSYPKEAISIGMLESDSVDRTFEVFSEVLPRLQQRFRVANLWKRDFDFKLPLGTYRRANHVQVVRRIVLAKARNHLLFRALDDEDWVLWLDVDVIEYPTDVIEQLLRTGKEIVHPHCVRRYGGPTFDRNAWRDRGTLHMDKLRSEGELVPLDSVGGTMLLVKSDLHRDGLIFPSFPYGRGNRKIRTDNYWQGEIETEGFGIMADDMGLSCWGLPRLEIKHHAS
jgi:hypothetical protein